MSEAERKRRFDYKKNRSKWIRIQALIIAIVSLLTVLLAFTYYNTSKNRYINYTEKGDVNYKVYLKENDFYKEEYLGKDQVYVADLVDKVSATLKYELNMEESVNYSYSYKVNAVFKMIDKYTGRIIYSNVDELVPEKTGDLSKKSQKLKITELVEIDYDKYNDMAKSFLDKYPLSDVDSSVVIEMQTKVISDCDSFKDEHSQNDYTVSLNIPLTKKKVDITMESSVPTSETKILACTENAGKTVALVLFIVFGVLDVLLVGFLIVFIFITRNTDINYEIKVNRILSSYKSYIQQIVNPFDDSGYQILMMKNFSEMLEIRETIHSPILMNENEDKTRTLFLIPTNTKLLYVYEIKVDDYDEIYGAEEEVKEEAPAEEASEIEAETIVIMEKVDADELAHAIATPDVALEDIDYDMDDDEDEDEGVEVIGVVWPERPTHNKVYRYDPNGERVTKGDVVLVPSRDAKQNKDIIRKATVAHGNHKIDPDHLSSPLKKIIGIVKRKAEAALMSKETDK